VLKFHGKNRQAVPSYGPGCYPISEIQNRKTTAQLLFLLHVLMLVPSNTVLQKMNISD
jgi:hypothetical protein